MKRITHRLWLLTGIVCATLLLLAAAGFAGMQTLALLAVALLIGQSLLLYQLLQQYRDAKLILENRIFDASQVSVCPLYAGVAQPLAAVEVVFSPFGVLLGNRVFRFGDGVRRLQTVEIGKETVRVEFHSAKAQYHLLLLHGLTLREEIERVAEQIRYETGVTPTILAWK